MHKALGLTPSTTQNLAVGPHGFNLRTQEIEVRQEDQKLKIILSWMMNLRVTGDLVQKIKRKKGHADSFSTGSGTVTVDSAKLDSYRRSQYQSAGTDPANRGEFLKWSSALYGQTGSDLRERTAMT